MPAGVHGDSLCVLSVNTTVFGLRHGSGEDGLFVFSVKISHSWVTGVVYTHSFACMVTGTHTHTHTHGICSNLNPRWPCLWETARQTMQK